MAAPRHELIRLVRKAVTLPPHVTAAKVAGRMRTRFERSIERVRDRVGSTSGIRLGIDSQPEILRYLDVIPRESLEAQADIVRALAPRIIDHRFNLLGSGWVQVSYGCACAGLAGHRYSADLKSSADAEGRWLEAVVPTGYLSTAQQVWRLVSKDYVPIDWQLDFISGYRWSAKTWSPDIRYGHLPGVDVKVVWELARMQHLPQLAAAYALSTSDRYEFECAERYQNEFCDQILDFIATNPPRYGVNWNCTMDVALRAANWLLAYDLFRAVGATFSKEFNTVFAESLRDHGRHIFHHLEWSPEVRGNHYLANLTGLLFVAAYLPCDLEFDRWLLVAARELVQEVQLQFREDGTNFEGSTCYHRLSLEMGIYATALLMGLGEDKLSVLARGVQHLPRIGPTIDAGPKELSVLEGRELLFDRAHLERLRRGAEFTRWITKPSGQVAQIGDHDSGRFAKLTPILLNELGEIDSEEDHLDHRSVVAAATGLGLVDEPGDRSARMSLEKVVVRQLARGGIAKDAPEASTDSFRMNGHSSPVVSGASDLISRRMYVVSAPLGTGSTDLMRRGFEDFGLYVYRSNTLYLAIRCGGRDQIATGGHEHCDQLSIELQLGGVDIIRDPGTFVYTSLADERNRYRGPEAHFVPRFPGLDGVLYPEELRHGLFQLAKIQRGSCLRFDPTQFVGQRKVNQWTVTRTVHIEPMRVVITDECAGPRRMAPRDTARTTEWARIPFSPGYGIQRGIACEPSLVFEVSPLECQGAD